MRMFFCVHCRSDSRLSAAGPAKIIPREAIRQMGKPCIRPRPVAPGADRRNASLRVRLFEQLEQTLEIGKLVEWLWGKSTQRLRAPVDPGHPSIPSGMAPSRSANCERETWRILCPCCTLPVPVPGCCRADQQVAQIPRPRTHQHRLNGGVPSSPLDQPVVSGRKRQPVDAPGLRRGGAVILGCCNE